VSRKIEETIGKSLVVGELPEGCRMCMRGAKLVLFITGLCNATCFYCPLDESRKNRDVMYANEVKATNLDDVIKEAESMRAEGTGITGGDPLIVLHRTLGAIKTLKKHFSEKHHIHLYTNAMKLTLEKAKMLKKAGLDELRIHPTRSEDWRKVLIAKKAGLVTGVEIPAIPGKAKEVKRKMRILEALKVDFININELEFTASNSLSLKLRGFKLKQGSLAAVEGSEEEALNILEWAAKNTRLNVHYCPSRLKDQVQLKNRLRRRAAQVALKHEEITDEGLLVKGVIEVEGDLSSIRNEIIKKLKIPSDLIVVNEGRRRIETTAEIAIDIASAKLLSKASIFIVEEYPTADRLEVTRIPVGRALGKPN